MEYNQIALRVMKELDVPVNDLPAALGDAKESARLHDGGGIHFTEEGSRKLAAVVAAAVIKHLPARGVGAPSLLFKTESFDRDPRLGRPQQPHPAEERAEGDSGLWLQPDKCRWQSRWRNRRTHPALDNASPLRRQKFRQTLDDKFSASGSFAVTKSEKGGAGVFFGFFNSQQPGGSGRPIGSLGLDFDLKARADDSRRA